ncbi:hypothetical protein METHB2_340020 [Candidatus Methylobacter favarea]|uniref:Uncharacterized protein n=1 Tax=Candidatus Methylobacter favarea TaxID=2707345 RepID=A0A8S0XSU4_9GAMM|nr:hypothetical protein METHB2_340020 [Candidatus Methylobacter favarea]
MDAGDIDTIKKLDDYRNYITHLLQTYPSLLAVKVLPMPKATVDRLNISDRSYSTSLEGRDQLQANGLLCAVYAISG